MEYQGLSSPAIAGAVSHWCARHPADWPTSHGTCPICHEPGCFGRLPDRGTTARWACFNSAHVGPGVAGAGCFTGDALDIEAHRSRLSRMDVLRRDGYLDGRPRPSAPTIRRPLSTKAATMEDAWIKLQPGCDPVDLVRRDRAGVEYIRCFGRTGYPAGLRRLDMPLPRGWLGSTPDAAAVLLIGAAADEVICLGPDAATDATAGLPSGASVLVCRPEDVAAVNEQTVLLVPNDDAARWRDVWPARDVRPWPALPPSLRGPRALLATLASVPDFHRTIHRLANAIGPLTLESLDLPPTGGTSNV